MIDQRSRRAAAILSLGASLVASVRSFGAASIPSGDRSDSAAAVESAGSAPRGAQVDVTSPERDLIRRAVAAEAWIGSVGSCSVAWEVWEFSRSQPQPARGGQAVEFPRYPLAERLKSLAERHPGQKPDHLKLALTLGEPPNGPPSARGTLQFDRQRIAESRQDANLAEDRKVWNGEQGFSIRRSAKGASELCIAPHPTADTRASFLGWSLVQWARLSNVSFWWNKMPTNGLDFPSMQMLAPEEIDGVLCLQVTDRSNVRFFFSAESGDLRATLVQVTDPATPHLEIVNTIRATAGLPSIATLEEFQRWITTLEPLEREAVLTQHRTLLQPYLRPFIAQRFDDWRDVRPGQRVPFRMSTAIFDDLAKSPTLDFVRVVKLTSFTLDEPLDDALLAMPPRVDGMRIVDTTVDPEISWVHPAEPDEHAKQAIAERQKRELAAAEERRKQLDAMNGALAPEFPVPAADGVQWLIDGPLDASAFRNQVTIVLFFATWCGPCRAELTQARELLARRDGAEVRFIGVHAAGTPPDAVLKFASDIGFTWPLLLDAPHPQRAAFGVVAGLYGVRAIPQAFLVDHEGRIAGHGHLDDLYRQGISLARQRAAKLRDG